MTFGNVFGSALLGAGAVANGVGVQSSGTLTVQAGGSASGTVLSAGSLETVEGTTSGTVILAGGRENVTAGGSATALSVGSGGLAVVYAGGVAAGAVVSNGGELQAYGTVSGDTVRSGGAVYIFSGGTVSGTTLDGGFLGIRSGATAGTSRIDFTGAGGTLQLDDSQHFDGVISGFDQGGIDLRDIAFGVGTTLGYQDFGTSGTLTVSDGTHTASIHLLGQYVEANFTKQSDGAGGTLITDPPVASFDAFTLTPRTV
jgi:autotransporter passenger strand-loop-strand repeat protein